MSLTHTFGLLTNPDNQWKAIRKDSESVTRLYMGHVLLLALIPAVAGFVGTTQVGWQIGNGQVTRLSINSALSLSVLFYAAMLAGIFILGKFINFFRRPYVPRDQKREGVALAASTETPMSRIGFLQVNLISGWIMWPGFLPLTYAC